MKKFLSLSFLLLSLLIHSQNEFSSIENYISVSYPNSQNTNNLLRLDEVNKISPEEEIPLIEFYETEEFSSELLKKRLEKLKETSPFEVEYNATVERVIRLYLSERKEDISNLMDKATYYFPIFEEYLDKYNLPLEIKYLAIVESALEPNARSISGAKGLWQFMYHTGKEYGLEVTSFIDERSDPLKSTEAACKYLERLYGIFNDWDLALAAYNSGPGNVKKAIKRAGGLHNYWNIRKYLPKETRSYVPAFYAIFYLFEYAKEHQIAAKNMRITYFDTDTIHIKSRLTFSKIKQEITIDDELLTKLNPQYKLGIIPYSKTEANVLTLPKSVIQNFIAKEAEIYNLQEDNISQREASNHIIPTINNSYIVQQGDNFSKIAKKFNISILQIKEWNGLQTDYLIAGQRIVITNNTKSKENTTSNYNVTKYTVKEGDSLFIISKRFPNITVSQLRSWNNMWGVTYLKPGTELKILTSIK